MRVAPPAPTPSLDQLLAELAAAVDRLNTLLTHGAPPPAAPGPIIEIAPRPQGVVTVQAVPPQVLATANAVSVAAEAPFPSQAIPVPGAGRLGLRLVVTSAAVVSVTETPGQTPSGGGALAPLTATLNQGTALTAGAWYAFALPALPDATYQFTLNVATAVSYAVYWEPAL
jgi:hypothetical protein